MDSSPLLYIEKQEIYFKHLDTLSTAIVVAEVESGDILYANKAAQSLWMKDLDTFVGKSQTTLHSAYWNDRARETFSKDIQRLSEGESVTHTKNAILRSDGKEISVEIRATMVNIEDSRALVGAFISVEDRDRAYEILHNKEQEWQAIFDNSQIGILYLKNGRFVYKANQRLADILGYASPEEMVGLSMEKFHLSYERFVWFGEHHYKALSANESTHINYEVAKKDGTSLWVSLSGKAIDNHTPADLSKGVIWIVDDISDYKALEFSLKNQNKRLQGLLENINGISWELDIATNRFSYVSPTAEKILGYKPNEWKNFDSWKMMVHPEDRDAVVHYCQVETKARKDHQMEYRMVAKDGSIVWVMDIVTVGLNNENEPTTLYGFIIDITQNKEHQLQIEHEHTYLQNIVDGVDDAIMVIREDYTIEVMNHSIKSNLDKIDIADKENPKCYEVSHHRSTPCDGVDHPCPLKEVMEKKESLKVIHNHKDIEREDHFVELVATPLLDEDGNCRGIIESSRDITEHLSTLNELKVKSALLDFKAHHDDLTGLPNRTLYHDRVEQAIQKAKRFSSKFVLFFIDLDHFKEVNDSLGHGMGDKILLEASQRLQNSIREEDTLARLGGDEFTILLEHIENIQDSSHIAQKILDAFRKPFVIEGHILYLTCSIGISIYPDDSKLSQDLLKFADNAMYKAKKVGRDNFQFYTKEMTELAFERVMLESNIRQALANEEFSLYYQPQYDARSETIVGMEALIRWKHPLLGLISPAKFIPIAEESTLIIEIDNWVMNEAMQKVAHWYRSGLNPGVLSLNLAIKQLESKGFIEQLKTTMQETSFKPEWLKFEVLERDVMNKPQESIEKLMLLHQLGVQLSLDDFGTGQSSLTYLKKFPITQLKIDQSFVRDIDRDEEDRAIILTIIALAKALKLEIVAEGVETKEQLDFLMDKECYIIQGYYFSQPLPSEKMFEKLK